MLERLEDLIKGSHSFSQSRGVKDGNPIIYVDCTHCSFSTIWMPWESPKDVAKRWNRNH